MSEEEEKEYLAWCMKNQNYKERTNMNDKEKRVELPRWNDDGTFQKDGDTFYNWISEQRIREIIREEIVLYNETFMEALTDGKEKPTNN